MKVIVVNAARAQMLELGTLSLTRPLERVVRLHAPASRELRDPHRFDTDKRLSKYSHSEHYRLAFRNARRYGPERIPNVQAIRTMITQNFGTSLRLGTSSRPKSFGNEVTSKPGARAVTNQTFATYCALRLFAVRSSGVGEPST
jgi:hypothetical protein